MVRAEAELNIFRQVARPGTVGRPQVAADASRSVPGELDRPGWCSPPCALDSRTLIGGESLVIGIDVQLPVTLVGRVDRDDALWGEVGGLVAMLDNGLPGDAVRYCWQIVSLISFSEWQKIRL